MAKKDSTATADQDVQFPDHWDSAVELESIEATLNMLSYPLQEDDDPESRTLACALQGLARRLAVVGDLIVAPQKKEVDHDA